MLKNTLLILIVLTLISQGCMTRRTIVIRDFDIDGITETVELNDTITALVLGYTPAFKCNDTTYSHSVCFCMDFKTDEIYNVKTYCNTDSTICKGDIIKVVPYKPEIVSREVTIINSVYIKKNRELKVSPLYKIRVKTTSGIIVKL